MTDAFNPRAVWCGPFPQAQRPGAEHTFEPAVAHPHRQAGFSHVQILGGSAPALPPHGFGRDGAHRKAARTAGSVCSTSRPPTALEQANGGFLDSTRNPSHAPRHPRPSCAHHHPGPRPSQAPACPPAFHRCDEMRRPGPTAKTEGLSHEAPQKQRPRGSQSRCIAPAHPGQGRQGTP